MHFGLIAPYWLHVGFFCDIIENELINVIGTHTLQVIIAVINLVIILVSKIVAVVGKINYKWILKDI